MIFVGSFSSREEFLNKSPITLDKSNQNLSSNRIEEIKNIYFKHLKEIAYNSLSLPLEWAKLKREKAPLEVGFSTVVEHYHGGTSAMNAAILKERMKEEGVQMEIVPEKRIITFKLP